MSPRNYERERPYHDDGSVVAEIGPETVTVEHTEKDTWTGLYDQNGVPLHREKLPFGFMGKA